MLLEGPGNRMIDASKSDRIFCGQKRALAYIYAGMGF
jgi:hypothetical protein